MSFSLSATLVVALSAALAASLPAIAQPSAKYEPAPKLAGKDLAPEPLLTGPLHTVAEPIAIEGFMGRFEIDSKFGKFHVAGTDLLGVRVRELAAIEALDQVEKGVEFQQALARSAQVPVRFVGNAITDPGGTVENVAMGFGTVLGRVGRLAVTGAHAVGDTASDITSSGSRPEPPPAPADEPVPPSFTGDPFGFNRARREWAKRLGIDPYTTNPVLRVKLDSAARASFAGEFPVNVAIGIVAAPLQYAATFDNIVRDSIWNLPVGDLVARNEAKLRAMGISGRPVRDFFRNRWFTPTLQTALVAALEELPNVRGRDAVILAATAVSGEARARSFIGAVRMLAQYQHDVAPLAKIRMSGIVAVGSAAKGELVVATDLDYIGWNAEAAQFAARTDLAAKQRTLLVSGAVSPRATGELASAHWAVRSGLRPQSAH
ncbi:MAG: hypothetical protein IT522_04585 [Burkholderiales bacterium]|nr:hypothetical protein [Burkholderiales bacterium]